MKFLEGINISAPTFNALKIIIEPTSNIGSLFKHSNWVSSPSQYNCRRQASWTSSGYFYFFSHILG